MKKNTQILILCTVFFLQGCIPFIASQLGYVEAKAKYTKLYDTYKIEQEEINMGREKNGLAPVPVKEYRVWLKEQPLKSNEIKVFKNNGLISAEEAKSIKQRGR